MGALSIPDGIFERRQMTKQMEHGPGGICRDAMFDAVVNLEQNYDIFKLNLYST